MQGDPPPPDFLLCGPLRMRRNGQLTDLSTNLQNEVLALLLSRANTPVTVTDIIASVWPYRRESADVEFIRPYISRIRKDLVGTPARVTTLTHRYRLDVNQNRVDLLRFEALLAEADRADDPKRQREAVDDALAVCPTSQLLSDFTRTWAHNARTRHKATRFDAVLRRNRYWLRDGLHESLLLALRQEGAANSTHPQLVEDYVLALYRCGQVAKAIEHCDALIGHLCASGTPVPARLRGLADRVRRRDPTLDRANGRPVTSAPDTLPPPVGGLVGRHQEIQAIRRHADTSTHEMVRVIGVYGPPGIGKTALATAYAHRHKERYPDGALFADLGAYGLAGSVDVAAVLGAFLVALGVGSDQLPPEFNARLDRYRDLTCRRALLVVLDNVATTQTAAALLPSGRGSLVIVTSRSRLTTLTSRYGALPVVLDRIDEVSARTLLTRFLDGHPDSDNASIHRIASSCAGHPLAICLAGARIATRPEDPLAAVAEALDEPARRIPTLDRYAEPGDAVADVFGWSYQSLAPIPARVFRVFGLSPCPSLDMPTASALTGMSPADLTPVLAELAAGHLIAPAGHDRYRMLDLIAEYATKLTLDIDPAADRAAALDRLYAYHRTTARAAAHRLWPAEVESESGIVFTDAGQARRWLDEHRDDLITAARHEQGMTRPQHVIELANCLFRYLDHGGHLDQAVHLNEAAVVAATSRDDTAQIARAMVRLGAVLVRRGQVEDAQRTLAAAHTRYVELDDARGQALALGNLGRAAARRGAYDEATACHQKALRLLQAVGDAVGEARTLTNLGIVCEARRDFVGALRHHESARAICESINIPDAMARALGSIAGVLQAQGRLKQAERRYRDALVQFRTLGDRIGEATTLTNLGLVRSAKDDPAGACELHKQALDLFEETGDQANAVETLNNLGTALVAAGQPEAAVRRHHEALTLAGHSGNRKELARAHAGLTLAYLARAAREAGPVRVTLLASARDHYWPAIEGYDQIGIGIPAELTGLDDQFPPEGTI